MTTDADDIKAVIVQGNHHVIVQIVRVSLDQPRFGDAERLPTHVAQQALGALDVYLDDGGAMLLQQRVNLCRVKHRVRDDRHAIIITTDRDQVAQVHVNRDDVSSAKPEPMIHRRDVRLLMPHPEVASTQIQHRDAGAVNVAPMIDGCFAANAIVQVWRMQVHGSLRSLRLA